LVQAVGALDYFSRRSREDAPPELAPMRALLNYDMAALMANHLINEGEIARRRGTGFIAELVIVPTLPAVPTPMEMHDAFRDATFGMLHAAVAAIEEAEFPSAEKQTLLTLCARNEMLLDKTLNIADAALEARHRQLTDRLSGPLAGAAMEAVHARPDDLLVLTRAPGSPTPAADH
jgi:hypothetical protein